MKKMLLGIAMLLYTIVLAIVGTSSEICVSAGLFALILTAIGFAQKEK